MARNPKYHALLAEMAAMHDRKNEDYASAGNPYSNFEYAGALGALFSDPVDIAFAVLIGVKLARLAELKGKGKTPKNESVADTHLDLAVYASLWGSYGKTEVPTQPSSGAAAPETHVLCVVADCECSCAHCTERRRLRTIPKPVAA